MQFREPRTSWENQGKRNWALRRGHPTPPHPHLHLQSCYCQLLVDPGRENHEFRSALHLERREVVMSCGATSTASLPSKLLPRDLAKEEISRPCKLWAFCSVTHIWEWKTSPRLPFWLRAGSECGWAGEWRCCPGEYTDMPPSVGGHECPGGGATLSGNTRNTARDGRFLHPRPFVLRSTSLEPAACEKKLLHRSAPLNTQTRRWRKDVTPSSNSSLRSIFLQRDYAEVLSLE